eukprot:GHRQ01026657.1.p2 GENE.GHRQ01026657.1~~GHRQ01026657.1.p2  ORF type:complete len:111 (+),score=3.72 GHRQ01026657.1:886-1218(+)
MSALLRQLTATRVPQLMRRGRQKHGFLSYHPAGHSVLLMHAVTVDCSNAKEAERSPFTNLPAANSYNVREKTTSKHQVTSSTSPNNHRRIMQQHTEHRCNISPTVVVMTK